MKRNNLRKPNSRKRKSSNTNTIKKDSLLNKQVSLGIFKLIGPILLSLLLAYVAFGYRGAIINRVHKNNCIGPKPGDYSAKIIYDAINFQHQIKENPNKKIELLTLLNDEVIWFRKTQKRTPKELIKTNSKYDNFCYATYPDCDINDDYSKNYEMRFIGYHRFREIDMSVVAVDKYFCKIEKGKISEIYSIPMNSLEKESFENNNYWYRNIFWAVFAGSLTIILVGRFLMSLPEGVISWVRGIVSRYFPL